MVIFPTHKLDLIKKLCDIVPSPCNKYLLIIDKHKVVGVYELQEITKILTNVHLNILPEHRQQHYGLSSYPAFIRFVKEFTDYKKLICTVSTNNLIMLQGLQKTQWKVSGTISKAIIWDNILTDLFIFEHNV